MTSKGKMIDLYEKLATWHDTNFTENLHRLANYSEKVSIYFSTSNGDVYLKKYLKLCIFPLGNLILSTKKQKIESYEAFQSYISKPKINHLSAMFHSVTLDAKLAVGH